MSLTLTNTSGRCQVFVLPHETYCRALGPGACECDVQPGRDARRTATSLTLATGVTSPTLDDAVLDVPDVARAIRRGDVALTRLATEAQPTSPSPTAEGAPVSDVSQAKKKRGVR